MKVNNLKINHFYLAGILLFLALPLLYLPPWFSPPDWGRTIIFRTILAVMIFLFFWQILSKTEEDKKLSFSKLPTATKSVLLLLVAFWAILLLSTLFSLDFRFSFWGTPYRAGGFLNFTFYTIFTILTFLILDKKKWQKIWDFAIIVGILVSVVALFQQFGLFGKTLIPFEVRPPSTLANPLFLAVYLLLLVFLPISFGIEEKRLSKKIFYFFSLFIFVFIILLSYARAAYIGVFFGFFYFLFFYPKKVIWLKIIPLVILIFGVFGLYFINTSPELPKFVQENNFLLGATQRVLIKNILQDPRVYGWKTSLEALMNRPILGYGPENFHIAFNKFYDSSRPGTEIMYPPDTLLWWDRGHNFIFDISITSGIPALIIYLILFIVLLWQLQKTKTKNPVIESRVNPIKVHGVQATILAYLIANLFTFDTFSSYLISFLLIAYSLHLISSGQSAPIKSVREFQKEKSFLYKLKKHRIPVLSSALLFLALFVWFYNLKPLSINAEINKAQHLSEDGYCDSAVLKMEKIIPKKSFLDSFSKLNYADILLRCRDIMPEFGLEISERGRQILKDNIETHPYYLRYWLLLINFTNSLIERETNPDTIKELKKEANYYFENAWQLAPRRQEVFREGIITDLLTKEFYKAKEKSQKCIDLNPMTPDCHWLMALTNIYLGKEDAAKENMRLAQERGRSVDSENSLMTLGKVYVDTRNYQKAIDVYLRLVEIKPETPLYRFYLALFYREIGDFENAKKEALILLELSPQNKEEIEQFLKTLK